MTARPFSDRIALVTGASRGIGYSVARALAREGAHVVAVARTTGGLEELDDEIKAAGGTATLVPLDLKDHEGIERLAAALAERYGRLDILVGNAGLGGSSSPLDHYELKEWNNVMAVNVTANWQLVRAMHALLRRSDAGRAVFRHLGVGEPTPAPIAGSIRPRRRRSKRSPAPMRTKPRRRRSGSTCSRPDRHAPACAPP